MNSVVLRSKMLIPSNRIDIYCGVKKEVFPILIPRWWRGVEKSAPLIISEIMYNFTMLHLTFTNYQFPVDITEDGYVCYDFLCGSFAPSWFQRSPSNISLKICHRSADPIKSQCCSISHHSLCLSIPSFCHFSELWPISRELTRMKE